jgi:hypothetical protein
VGQELALLLYEQRANCSIMLYYTVCDGVSGVTEEGYLPGGKKLNAHSLFNEMGTAPKL